MREGNTTSCFNDRLVVIQLNRKTIDVLSFIGNRYQNVFVSVGFCGSKTRHCALSGGLRFISITII